jgi:hypothetical protein
MTRKLVLLLTLCHGVLAAQQQPLAGVWQVTFQAGMRISDGEATPIMATGTLTVKPEADSLIGTLVTNSLLVLENIDRYIAMGEVPATAAVKGASEIALAAEDVRLAMRALGRITGTVRIDELLDIIFRDFCIGK